MFSSPLPYKRTDEPPTPVPAPSRYTEALPPPVPASPLRNPPPPPPPPQHHAPVHAHTYYASPSYPPSAIAPPPPPPLNHAYTAPARWTNTYAGQEQAPEREWAWEPRPEAESAWHASRPVTIDRYSHSQFQLQTEQTQYQGQGQEEESEATKLVRMMSRRPHRPPPQGRDVPPSPSMARSEWPPPQQYASDYDTQQQQQQQQMFSPNTGVFPLTLSPSSVSAAAAVANGGYFQPSFHQQQHEPVQQSSLHQQQEYNSYTSPHNDNSDNNNDNTNSNTYTPLHAEPTRDNSINNSINNTTTTTTRRYPLSPFPEHETETDSQMPSGTATPLPPYAVYPQSPVQPPSQTQSQSQIERSQQQHGFHLAGDVKSPPLPPASSFVSARKSSTTAITNNNNNTAFHPINLDTYTTEPPKVHHYPSNNHNKSGIGIGTGTGTGIVLGGMSMPNAQEYASIPSYGASVTSDDSSYYYTSEEEDSDSDSGSPVNQGQEQQLGVAGWEKVLEEDEEGRTQRERERHDSFPSLHSQLEGGAQNQHRFSQTGTQAQPRPLPAATPSQLERAGSLVAESIHSFRAGDEVGLTAVDSVTHENEDQQGKIKGKRSAEQGKEAVGSAGGASTGAGDKRSLVYSYHPSPADLPAPNDNEPSSEIPLFCAPTSFQLLGQSLKRLLADLMVSASTSFVPAPSAYASSSAETPVWRVEVWVRTFVLPVPPVAGALVVGKRRTGQGKRWIVGGGYRTMVGIELDEEVVRPALAMTASRSSGTGTGGTALALTRTRSSRYSHSGVSENEHSQQQTIASSTLPAKPAATTSDSTNTLLPAFTASHVLRLRLPLPLHAPFTAAQLVETLHKHYQYGKRVGRSTTTSLAPGTVEENAYAFARMVDRAPGPVDEAARLSKAHKLGRTAFWDGRTVPTPPDERAAGEDIQGQVGRKGFRYTMRKAVSKAVGAVQGEREDTVEDDRASWVTPFTG